MMKFRSFLNVIHRCINTFSGSTPASSVLNLPTSQSISYVTSHVWPPSSSTSSLTFNGCWDKVLAEGKAVVNYSSSYFDLSTLLRKDAHIDGKLKDFAYIDHPILHTAKRLIIQDGDIIRTRGLIVLLMAKAVGCNQPTGDLSNEILRKQCSFAEMTEIIYSAYLIHRGIVNLSPLVDSSVKHETHIGNSMSILSGDYLLANVWKSLGELKDTKVVELMAQSISQTLLKRLLNKRVKSKILWH